MYCVNCGVKLGEGEKSCPLCGVRAWHPDVPREPGEKLYPGQRYPAPPRQSPAGRIVLTTIFLLPLVITGLCDLRINRSITWSGYVAGALLLAYTILVLPLWFPKKTAAHWAAVDFAGTAVYLGYICQKVEGSWFWSFALPVTAYLGVLVILGMVLLRRYPHRGFFILGGCHLALGALMPLMEVLIHCTFDLPRFSGWCIYPLAVLLVLGGMLLTLGISQKAREKMERKFFL